MRSNHFSLLVVLFLALVSTAVASTTWYVDGVNGFDGNNCTSPNTACKTIAHAIEAAVSGDSIIVAPATYTENLSISKNLRILGSGATATIIDGGGTGTVVTISSGSGVRLSGMTIRNGAAVAAGGGIENDGGLTLISSTVSGNTATYDPRCKFFCIGAAGGGINNSGRLTIDKSTISGNSAFARAILAGGGILNYGTVTIRRSTISGNTGGGIVLYGGNATISQSTFSGNGTGIFVFIYTMTMSVSNSTISGNGGGIEGSSLTKTKFSISNSTVSENSGAGVSGKTPGWVLQNSIVANNSGGNCSETVTSHGHNLSSDATCDFDGPGDRNNIDPKLGPLQNNGGPTQTMALPSGSPAIDAGNPNGCTDNLGNLLKTDQRGFPRHDKEDTRGCDIGAYESQRD